MLSSNIIRSENKRNYYNTYSFYREWFFKAYYDADNDPSEIRGNKADPVHISAV